MKQRQTHFTKEPANLANVWIKSNTSQNTVLKIRNKSTKALLESFKIWCFIREILKIPSNVCKSGQHLVWSSQFQDSYSLHQLLYWLLLSCLFLLRKCNSHLKRCLLRYLFYIHLQIFNNIRSYIVFVHYRRGSVFK